MRRRTLRWTTTLATALALTLGSVAVPASAAPPDRDDLRPSLRQVVRAGGVGVTVHVVDRGSIRRGAAGSARLAPREDAVAGARFRAASVTKQLTTVLALQEVQRGRWTLGTTVGDVLPGLWPARADVTLGQLLSHRSGVPDYLAALVARASTERKLLAAVSQRRTDRELVRVAKRLDWLFEPGTDYSYSNTGYVIIGLMLRAATGRSLPALAQQRILRPAGMTSSRWAVGRRVAAPKLREYADLGDRRPLDLSSSSPTMFSAAGALVSTARDLNRFQRALSTGRLLAPRLVDRMRSVVTPADETGLGVAYGYGSYRIPDPCRPGRWLHGHDGASWGTHTLSFSSRDGRRRVTAAMTGRQYTKRQPAYAALNRLVVTAFASTCRGGAAAGARGLPAAPVDGVLPRLAGAPAR